MLCYHRDSHATYVFCKQGGQKNLELHEQKVVTFTSL
jgi:hypothetical protein